MITDDVPAVRVPPDHAVEAWLRLSRREDTWKTAEILFLRHQLTSCDGGGHVAHG